MNTASLSKAFGTLLLATLLTGCYCKDIPRNQKLTECTSNALSFGVAWPTGALFQVVLGVPYGESIALGFRGEIVFRQSTGTVVRVPLASDDITYCNWLDNHASSPHVTGYILTWGRTNPAERLDHLLTKGEIYDVEARFSEPPPKRSALWLHWLGH